MLAVVLPNPNLLILFVLLVLIVVMLNPSTNPAILPQTTPFSSAFAFGITSLFLQPKNILLLDGQIFGANGIQ